MGSGGHYGSSISWQDTGDGGARVVLSGRLTIDDVATLADELATVPPRAREARMFSR